MTTTFSEPNYDPFDERLEVQHHPIRGFFWGLVAGLGLAIVLVVTKVISLSLIGVIVTIGVMTVLAIMWGVFGPPTPPSGPVPVTVVGGAPPASRFDDFDPPRPAAEPSPDFDVGTDADADADDGGED